jgi:hypothetical protein
LDIDEKKVRNTIVDVVRFYLDKNELLNGKPAGQRKITAMLKAVLPWA